MKVLGQVSDRNFGARNMDYLLVDKVGEEFMKKVGSDTRKNVRTRLRMLDMIEKQGKNIYQYLCKQEWKAPISIGTFLGKFAIAINLLELSLWLLVVLLWTIHI